MSKDSKDGDYTAKRKKERFRVRVTGFAVAQEKKSTKQHEIFVSEVSWGEETWTSYRRYSQFLKCYEIVKKILGERTPSFPGKKFWAAHDAKFLEERRDDLNDWMIAVAVFAAAEEDLKEVMWAFLSCPDHKHPPAGMGTIFKASDVGTRADDVNRQMSEEKEEIGEKVSAEQEAAERAEAEAMRKLREVERKRDAQKQALEKLKAGRTSRMGLLRKGAWFVKHGRMGRPKRKFVCVEKMDKSKVSLDIVWKTHDHDTPKKKSSVPFDSVVSVLRGRKSKLFEKVSGVDETLCFSLMLQDAYKDSLDLQADSKELRETWCEAFSFMLSYKKERERLEDTNELIEELEAEDDEDDKKSALELASEKIEERHLKLTDAEVQSEQLATSAGEFEKVASDLLKKSENSMFGKLASMLDDE